MFSFSRSLSSCSRCTGRFLRHGLVAVVALLLVASVSNAVSKVHRPAAEGAGPGVQDQRVQNIEADATDITLREGQVPLRLSLAQLMQVYDVPGVSIAVIDNYRIAWAQGYGVIATGSSTRVDARTLFQAGSISKPLTTTTTLTLVEQGKLSLDEDVNQKLLTWKLPENEFTKDEKVTLRRIITHTGGLTVSGFPGYDVDAPLPTVAQILNGEKPANSPPIRVDFAPGSQERYSGGGVVIEQQLITDVTGKAFPVLMRETVLHKLGMMDSTYEQPLPAALSARAANGTLWDGQTVHGGWHVYPEMAAAGLWTTPTDLAKFAIEIAQSRRGMSNKVLSQKTVEEMLTPGPHFWSLGFHVENENPGQFGHNGGNEGFQAVLTMNWQTGKGAVIMANSDNGIALADLVLPTIANEYGWKNKFAPPQTLLIIAKLRGIQAALDRYTELKKSGASDYEVGEHALNQLGYRLLYSGHEQDAILAFQRNAREYPQSSNVYDSLAEAYMKTGQKGLAIENYEKSLQLDTNNQNAKEKLRELQQTK